MSAKLISTEVTILIDDASIVEWGMPVGDPFETPLPTTMIFLAEDVHGALRTGTSTWPGRGLMQLTRAGFASVATLDGGRAVYELFPAKFDDHLPYKPTIYVGRWPD